VDFHIDLADYLAASENGVIIFPVLPFEYLLKEKRYQPVKTWEGFLLAEQFGENLSEHLIIGCLESDIPRYHGV